MLLDHPGHSTVDALPGTLCLEIQDLCPHCLSRSPRPHRCAFSPEVNKPSKPGSQLLVRPPLPGPPQLSILCLTSAQTAAPSPSPAGAPASSLWASPLEQVRSDIPPPSQTQRVKIQIHLPTWKPGPPGRHFSLQRGPHLQAFSLQSPHHPTVSLHPQTITRPCRLCPPVCHPLCDAHRGARRLTCKSSVSQTLI